MHSRRNLLTRFTERTAAAIRGVSQDESNQAPPVDGRNAAPCDCSHPRNGPYAHHFLNVVVQTHQGERALFYDDLLKGKMVMINCMSVKDEAVFQTTSKLVKVQRLLREGPGRDVLIYSITVDPEHDTPRVLKAFAEKHEAGPGWLFLTGEAAAMQHLRNRLFVSGDSHDHGEGSQPDCSLAMIRYGNEAVGLWGAVPARTDPELIAMRLSWIRPEQPAVGMPRRAGPPPLSS